MRRAPEGRRELVMLRDLANGAVALWHDFEGAFDPYRPERHYMRGPGPKWHAKRAAAAGANRPELPDAAEARA